MFKKGQIVRLVQETPFIWAVNILDRYGKPENRRAEVGELFRVIKADSGYLELQSLNKDYWVSGIRDTRFEAL
jgi:hypothetical protein